MNTQQLDSIPRVDASAKLSPLEIAALDALASWLSNSGMPNHIFGLLVGDKTLELYRNAKARTSNS